MKVGSLKVRWQYQIEENKKEIKIKTLCFLEKNSSDVAIAVGGVLHISRKNIESTTTFKFSTEYEKKQLIKENTYNKEIGRRLSFKKMLEIAYPYTNPSFKEEHKKFRKQFWEAYRTMSVIPRWNLKIK